MESDAVLDFWFQELSPRQWFAHDASVDAAVRARFADCHAAASRGECYGWRTTPQGQLAEVIVLDQLSRNLHRGDPRAFATDGMALVLAQEAFRQGAHRHLTQPQRNFLCLPYMHSESRRIHAEAAPVFAEADESVRQFEAKHKAIVDRFGRYPHRNAIVGRTSTAEELAFLQQPGSSF